MGIWVANRPGISLMRSTCRKYMKLPPESSVSAEFTRFWSTCYTKLEQPTPVACHVNAILVFWRILACLAQSTWIQKTTRG